MKRKRAWRRWLAVVALAFGHTVGAAPPTPAPITGKIFIGAIRFEGNIRTREQILRQEIVLEEGDTVTPHQIDKARQSIMDLGLFEWVKARVEDSPEGKTVVFTMDEKFFLLPVPLVNGDPSKHEYSFGMELRVDNLGVLNQRIRLKYEENHPGSDITPFGREGSISYQYPRVVGSAYNLNLAYGLRQDDFHVFNATGRLTAEYHRNMSTVTAGLSRWLDIKGPSRGWFGGTGLSWVQHEYTLLSGTPADYRTSQAVSMTANVGRSDVHDHGFYTTGSAYGWKGELGTKLFGSDDDFTRHLFYYRNYDHFNPKLNLNWQMRLGLSSGKPFGSPAYSIGGFKTLRGYQKEIEGNALALSNLEYHHQIDNWPTVRGVWFLDVGNVYERITDINAGDLETGTGFGVRWRVQKLVDVTISADWAYGFGPHEQVFYAMTTGTF